MGYQILFDVRDTAPGLADFLRSACLGVLIPLLAVLACVAAYEWRRSGQQLRRALSLIGTLLAVAATLLVLVEVGIYAVSFPRQELAWLESGDFRVTEAAVSEVFLKGHTRAGGPVVWFRVDGQQFRRPRLPAGESLEAGDKVRVTHHGDRLLRLEKSLNPRAARISPRG